MPKTFECKQCNKTITTNIRSNGRYEYCSQECSYNGIYGKTITDGVFTARSQEQLLALNLYNAGKNVRAAAKESGIGADILYDLIFKNKDTFSERICTICGKSMTGMKLLGVRKYCSSGCKYAAARARLLSSEATIARDVFSAEKAAERAARIEKVVGLYRMGYSQNEIVKILGIAQGTISKDLRNHYKDVEPSLYFESAFYKERESAKDADEWRAVLRKYVILAKSSATSPSKLSETAEASGACNDQEKPHILLIRPVRGIATQNHLTAIVCDEMKLNPYSGQVFVFCGSERWSITTLTWSGEMFITTKHYRQKSRYIWPSAKIGGNGGYVEITKGELEFLLSYYKTNQRKRREYFESIGHMENNR